MRMGIAATPTRRIGPAARAGAYPQAAARPLRRRGGRAGPWP